MIITVIQLAIIITMIFFIGLLLARFAVKILSCLDDPENKSVYRIDKNQDHILISGLKNRTH